MLKDCEWPMMMTHFFARLAWPKQDFRLTNNFAVRKSRFYSLAGYLTHLF